MIVYKVRVLVSKHLPPSWVLAWDCSEVVTVSIVLDVHDIILPLLRSHSLWYAVEWPSLCQSVLNKSLKSDVSSSKHLSDSSHRESWDKVEWSVTVKTEVWVKSLSDRSFLFIKIDNLPELLGLSISLGDCNSLSFIILDSINSSSISEVYYTSSFKLE
jgi:hypothetical protein